MSNITATAASATTGPSATTASPSLTAFTVAQSHDDRGPELNAVVWTLTALAAVFLGLRIYCKLCKRRSLWWDDCIAIMSMIMLVLASTSISVAVHWGLGKHDWDIPMDTSVKLWFTEILQGFFAILATLWAKTSFAVTLLRISQGRLRKIVWVIIVSLNIVLGVALLFQYIQCTPLERGWNPYVVGGTCWPRKVMVVYGSFVGMFSGVMDIILALLPWRIIWKLTMNKKEKISISIAMSMGIFAGAASMLKTLTVFGIATGDNIDLVNLLILATVENAIAIIAISIPMLRALVQKSRHWTPRLPTADLLSDATTKSPQSRTFVATDQGPTRSDGGHDHGGFC